MSHSHPPPLAPPPPAATYETNRNNKHCATRNQIDECLWALPEPELQKACFLARVCAFQAPKYCQYRRVTSIQQVGPTCGLTALSMLCGGNPSSDELLITAKKLGYTNNGEIFSARNLFQLICDNLLASSLLPLPLHDAATNDLVGNSRNALKCLMHEGRLNCAKVRDELRAGATVLVPYP